VVIYGENLARFKARMYSIIFIGSDIFSLLLQAGGSIIVDASKPKSAGRQSGINLMVAGLIFQLISLTIFIALACDFAWRSFRRGPPVPEAFRRFSQLHLGFAGFVLGKSPAKHPTL